jgi:hypothetical protein
VPFTETTLPSLRESVWLLKTSIVGNYCISRPKGQFSTLVGDLICLGQVSFPRTGLDSACWAPSGLLSSCSHSDKGKN